MFIRRVTMLFLAALMLAACGGAPPAAQLATAPTDPTAAPAPTAAPPPTVAIAPRSTLAPASTAAPAPTDAPTPTAAPTLAEPTTAPTLAEPAPTAAPTLAEPAPTTAPAPTAVPQAPTPAATLASRPTVAPQPGASIGSELLFLRKGALIAFDTSTHKERQLADDVRDFTATPDAALIALIRGAGRQTEIWSVHRDGSALTQLTHNDRAEATLAWAPDGSALVFASAATDQPLTYEWQSWSAWCVASQVHLLNIAGQSETSFGAGCDPAFSPDGKRIAYATPPRQLEPDMNSGPMVVNTIRLINRQGQNGWNFAKAEGPEAPPPNTGRVVYAPAWSPDGKQLVYQRFLGYQALVDLDLTEIAGSLEGKGKPLDDGAGWLLPARFTPDGRSVAISENNAGDARGFGGYDNWSVSVVSLAGTHDIALPTGSIQAVGQQVDKLSRAQSAAWSPDGVALAVELPPGWNAELSPNQPVNADGQPGEIWRWKPGSAPQELLVKNVDFASPLVWLN